MAVTRDGTDSILDIGDAAEYLHIKKWTLYRLAKKGKIPGVKIGGQWRFKKEILDQMFADAHNRWELEAEKATRVR
jgi:excisionase family DNA binding protein